MHEASEMTRKCVIAFAQFCTLVVPDWPPAKLIAHIHYEERLLTLFVR